MLTEFDQMPDHARLWIYQAERSLTDQEVELVRHGTIDFLNQWQAHGQELKASFELKFNQFLILAVDESFSQVSGCSIDASVHLIKSLENKLHLSFSTSRKVAFFQEEKINLYPFHELKQHVQNKMIKPETQIFDNTIKNIADLNQNWLVPCSQTWMNRYFK